MTHVAIRQYAVTPWRSSGRTSMCRELLNWTVYGPANKAIDKLERCLCSTAVHRDSCCGGPKAEEGACGTTGRTCQTCWIRICGLMVDQFPAKRHVYLLLEGDASTICLESSFCSHLPLQSHPSLRLPTLSTSRLPSSRPCRHPVVYGGPAVIRPRQDPTGSQGTCDR